MRIYGRNPVLERLRHNPQSIQKIYLQESFSGTANIRKRAKTLGIPIHVVPKNKMTKLARNANAQGVLMYVDDYEYVDYQDLLERALKKKRTVLFFDELQDPQNLGAIIRSVACLGKFSIVLPTHKSVHVTETVLRVASGGDNYVPVAQVSNLNNAIKKAREQGFLIYGTVVHDGQPIDQLEFSHPTALVVGSEQKGVREVIKKNLDQQVSIPMVYDTLSLNVAHATSIFCYEIIRQQKKK